GRALRGDHVRAGEDPLRFGGGEAEGAAVGPQRGLVVVVAVGQRGALSPAVQPDDEWALAVPGRAVRRRVQPVLQARARAVVAERVHLGIGQPALDELRDGDWAVPPYGDGGVLGDGVDQVELDVAADA